MIGSFVDPHLQIPFPRALVLLHFGEESSAGGPDQGKVLSCRQETTLSMLSGIGS